LINNCGILGLTHLKTTTRTILDEITNIVPDRDRTSVIESRGSHVITSAINLLETIAAYYGPDVSDEMERRLVNSIRSRNPIKFSRGARKISESVEQAPTGQ